MVMEPVNIANANCGSLKEAFNSAKETQESVDKLKVLFAEFVKRVKDLEFNNDWVIAFLEKADIGEHDEKERVALLVKLQVLKAMNLPEEDE